MTPRERLLAAIRLEEPDVVPVCPLIDNHYAAFVTGVKVPEANWRHQILAIERIGHDAIILPDNYDETINDRVPALRWKNEITETGSNYRLIKSKLETPYGPLLSEISERDDCSAWSIRSPITSLEADYEKIVWFYEQLASGRYDLKGSYEGIRGRLHDRGLICARSGVGLGAGIEETIIELYRFPDLYKKTNTLALDSNRPLLEAAFEAGADLVFGGSNGTETYSPRLIEEFELPITKALIDIVHDGGAMFYFHCCGKSNGLLERFAELGPDLIETLAPPPSGNVDLGDAKRRIGDKVCLKGNMNLSILYNGTRDEIEKTVRDCIEKAGPGGGYILGTEDALQWGYPVDNIQAMVTMGRRYGAYAH